MGMRGQPRPRSDCADVHSDNGLCCPLPKSLDTIECINGAKYLAHAQDEVIPHILRMLEDTFSLNATHYCIWPFSYVTACVCLKQTLIWRGGLSQ